MSTTTLSQRSLIPGYRSLLRELRQSSIHPRPSRSPSLYPNARKLAFIDLDESESGGNKKDSVKEKENEKEWEELIKRKQADVKDFVLYLKSTRLHEILVKRYNPGTHLTQEERIKMTARRVGLESDPDFSRNSSFFAPNGNVAPLGSNMSVSEGLESKFGVGVGGLGDGLGGEEKTESEREGEEVLRRMLGEIERTRLVGDDGDGDGKQ